MRSVQYLKWIVLLLCFSTVLSVQDWNGRERRIEVNMNEISEAFSNPEYGILKDKNFQFGYSVPEKTFWKTEYRTNIWKRISTEEFIFFFSNWNVINEKDGPIFDSDVIANNLHICIQILERKHPIFNVQLLFQKALADENGFDVFFRKIVSPKKYVTEVFDWSIENISHESEVIINDIEEMFKVVMSDSTIKKVKTEIRKYFLKRTNLNEVFGVHNRTNWTGRPTLLNIIADTFYMKSNGIKIDREDEIAIYGAEEMTLPEKLISLEPLIGMLPLENNEKLSMFFKHRFLFFFYLFSDAEVRKYNLSPETLKSWSSSFKL